MPVLLILLLALLGGCRHTEEIYTEPVARADPPLPGHHAAPSRLGVGLPLSGSMPVIRPAD